MTSSRFISFNILKRFSFVHFSIFFPVWVFMRLLEMNCQWRNTISAAVSRGWWLSLYASTSWTALVLIPAKYATFNIKMPLEPIREQMGTVNLCLVTTLSCMCWFHGCYHGRCIPIKVSQTNTCSGMITQRQQIGLKYTFTTETQCQISLPILLARSFQEPPLESMYRWKHTLFLVARARPRVSPRNGGSLWRALWRVLHIC